MKNAAARILIATSLAAASLAACGGGGYLQPGEANLSLDQATMERVRHALDRDRRIGAERLRVRVVNGVVEISGPPVNQQARPIAVETARRVPGVRRVVDKMDDPL